MRLTAEYARRIGAALLSVFALATAAGAETVTKSMTVLTQIQAYTSLRISASSLHFNVADGSIAPPAPVAIDFQAAARTHRDGEVLLTVEQDNVLEGGEAPLPVSTVVWSGEGSGVQNGVLGQQPLVAGRWQGSGRRQGRLIFSVGATSVLAPGQYASHLRFVLSAP